MEATIIESLISWPVLIGLFLGTVICFTLVQSHLTRTRLSHFQEGVNSRDLEISILQSEKTDWQNERDSLASSNVELRERSASAQTLVEQIPALKKHNDNLQARNGEVSGLAKELETRLEEQSLRIKEKEDLLTSLRGEFKIEMKALAGDILDDKSKKFTEQNQVNIKGLVEPLKLQMKDFETKFIDGQKTDFADRAALITEVKQLSKAHIQTSDQTEQLIKAFKGDTKVQGTWGELVLERVLESSGLEKGREYDVQKTLKTDDGSSPRPDVLVYLPDNKIVIIDSKVSLTAYERFQSATTDKDKAAALAQHVQSVRANIKNLGSKNYQDVTSAHTLDFVLMFVPVESALNDALREAPGLFEEALNNHILLVAPSSMILALRTIEHIWRSERQNKNAQEIANRGGALYNKFAGFAEDLEKVGERINQAQHALGGARNKLITGPGNLVRQAEMLRELGAKTNKTIPASLLPVPEEELPIKEVESE